MDEKWLRSITVLYESGLPGVSRQFEDEPGSPKALNNETEWRKFLLILQLNALFPGVNIRSTDA